MKVNFFMYVVFRYLYTQPQPTNNAIYNIQEKVYLEHLQSKCYGTGAVCVHKHHQLSIRILVNNQWKTTRQDACSRMPRGECDMKKKMISKESNDELDEFIH